MSNNKTILINQIRSMETRLAALNQQLSILQRQTPLNTGAMTTVGTEIHRLRAALDKAKRDLARMK